MTEDYEPMCELCGEPFDGQPCFHPDLGRCEFCCPEHADEAAFDRRGARRDNRHELALYGDDLDWRNR
jgi:hypothetical protein